jgi:hypothetical protein
MMDSGIKTVVRIVLVAWFVIVNILILVPSFLVLWAPEAENRLTLQTPERPKPPDVMALVNKDADSTARATQVTFAGHVTTMYGHQAGVYMQQVNAYKTNAELLAKSPDRSRYQLVVKDTLVPLLTVFFSALITFAFINGTSSLINNHNLLKHGKDPQPINLL